MDGEEDAGRMHEKERRERDVAEMEFIKGRRNTFRKII